MAVPTDLRFFKPLEWKNDPSRVDPRLCYALDAVRAAAGAPIIIHVAFDTSGHTPKSYHYSAPGRPLAIACDFHFAGSISLADQFAAIRSVPAITAVGFYPKWVHPGFHVDLRDDDRLFWVQRAGRYIYFTKEQDFKLAAGIK